jgi:hypothetical protein
MKRLLYLAAFAATLTACTNDDSSVSDRVEAKITAGVGVNTRASETTWEAGDAIGVYVTGVTGTTEGTTSTMASLYTNAKYTISSGANTSSATFSADAADKIYFQDSQETVTFAAYCPYQSDATAVTVNTQTGNASADAQREIDLLYASGAQASKKSPAINFTGDNEFRHVMSRLELTVKLGTGFDSETLPTGATVKLSGLVHEGTLVLTGENAGSVTHDASAKAVSDWDVTSSLSSLILVPQDLSKTPLTVAITVDGQTYSNSTSINPSMQPGTSYSYSITVNRNGLTVSGSTISPWVSVAGDNGEATL